MRTKVISNTTVEYPDMIGFAFNPCVINVCGVEWESIKVTITCLRNGERHEENREMFGESCFFDLQHYVQGAFDEVAFGQLEYDSAEDTKLGALFDVEVSFYLDGDVQDSMVFQTFFVWGAMRVGERYNGERDIVWFKNFPFTIGMYSGANGTVVRYADGVYWDSLSLNRQAVWNIPISGMSASDKVRFILDGVAAAQSTFDNTFDLTFKAIGGGNCIINCRVDNSDDGIYIRWINRHGFYCYWLFANGDESRKVANDGEFLRNNMMGYNFQKGYNGGTGRSQRKTGENSLPVCAPLVDSGTFDFLFDMALSPVVDLYMGSNNWMRVNVSVGTFTKTRKVLQDFVATIVLPETRIQSL